MPEWLTTEELAARWQIPARTLRDWRHRGYGPPAVKLGRGQAGAVRYQMSEVERWERDQARHPAGAS